MGRGSLSEPAVSQSDDRGIDGRLLGDGLDCAHAGALPVETDEGPVVFVADLAPGRAWTHVAITMGYDRNPELMVEEKSALLPELLERRARLFYTHDPKTGLARLARDEKGRFCGEPL